MWLCLKFDSNHPLSVFCCCFFLIWTVIFFEKVTVIDKIGESRLSCSFASDLPPHTPLVCPHLSANITYLSDLSGLPLPFELVSLPWEVRTSFSACILLSACFCLLASQSFFLSPFVFCFPCHLSSLCVFSLPAEIHLSNKRCYGVSFLKHQIAERNSIEENLEK